MMDIASLDGTWDRSELPANVQLGEGCWIEQRASFAPFRSEQDPGVELGDHVRVYGGTRFSVEPSGTIAVGDRTVLVATSLLCAARIEIGADVIVSYQAMIADSDMHDHDPALRRADAVAHAPLREGPARAPIDAEPVHIGDRSRIGIGAIILKGVRIGAGAEVAPGAVVTRDAPPGAFVAGNPAREIARESWR